jgi:hypothetical protein
LNSISPHLVKTIIQSGKLQKKFKRSHISIPPIRKADRSRAKSDSEKAETFGEHVSQLFTQNDSNNHHNSDKIEKFLNAPCQISPPIKAFSPKELSQIIKKINEHKATGYDLITRKILRQLPKKAIVLTIIYNSMQ